MFDSKRLNLTLPKQFFFLLNKLLSKNLEKQPNEISNNFNVGRAGHSGHLRRRPYPRVHVRHQAGGEAGLHQGNGQHGQDEQLRRSRLRPRHHIIHRKRVSFTRYDVTGENFSLKDDISKAAITV